jgi:uroporphyrinogen decarboxylase
MNSRERFLKTINRKEPDRPPVFATLTPQMAKKLSDYTGIPYEEPLDSLLSTRISHTRLLLHLGNDAVGVAACAPADRPTVKLENGISKNEWGMVFKEKGLYNEFFEYPLAKVEYPEEIEGYPFPDPNAAGRFTEADRAIHQYQSDFAIIGDLETTLYETAWYLTGLDKLLMDLMLDTPYVNPLLDRIMGINLETGLQLIRKGVDLIWAGDDFGSQQGMMIDPATWRKYFKPRMKYVFDSFRKENPDIKIAWHTCGSVVPIIPEMIEIGLDILNPIQPEAKGMDPLFLKNEYGRDLIFFGGISVQKLLPFSRPEKIRDEVRRIAEILGKGGGYIIAPAHNIQNDTPVENAVVFFETIKNL